MLSAEIWQRRYHGGPGVVGRSIKINGKPHTVVGVVPPRFSFPETEKVWIPLGRKPQQTSAMRYICK